MTRIGKFFSRINLPCDTEISLSYDFLKLVQYNAVKSIAYENLDILAKKPLDLSYEGLFKKIVEDNRGGYCFEVNGLLTHILREAGFEVKEYFARFLRGEASVPMRRHRVLSVACEGERYFCDIGIGSVAPKTPLLIKEGVVQNLYGESYKFRKDDRRGWVLYELYEGSWREFISFTEDEQFDIDFVQPSFYCEAHPDSIFNKAPIIAIKTDDGRKTIDGRDYKIFEGNELVHIEENIDDERFYQLLKEEFRLTGVGVNEAYKPL